MSFLIDVVIPVKMPSYHIEMLRENLKHVPKLIRLNFVLDFGALEIPIPTALFTNQRANETMTVGCFGSPGKARNKGLSISTSRYVCFWDVDDSPLWQNLKPILRDMESNSVDIAIASWILSGSNGNTKRIYGSGPRSVAWSPGIWRMIFRRDLVAETTFSSEKWGEDQLFFAQILTKQPKIMRYSTPLYIHYQNSPGALTSKTEFVEDLIYTRKKMKKLKFDPGSVRERVVNVMIFRQALTIIKYGRLKLKLITMIDVLKTILSQHSSFATLLESKNQMKNW